MDRLEIFLYTLVTIISVCGLIFTGVGFVGEYKDAKINEEKRGIRNKYIVLFVAEIFIIIAAFIAMPLIFNIIN